MENETPLPTINNNINTNQNNSTQKTGKSNLNLINLYNNINDDNKSKKAMKSSTNISQADKPDEVESQTFELLYSPRTTYSNEMDSEEKYFTDLTLNFDPITIKLVKKHFKERLGSLSRIEFISILKNHLLSWHPNIPNREKLLIKLLNRLFSEIDLNDNGTLEWSEFTNYIIHNSNSLNNKNDTDSFRLRFYSTTKNSIDSKDLSENVSYAFYIEKHNLIGIVEDGKSLIHFYDANTLKKSKCFIDLKDIQKEIDDLDNRDLEERAKLKKKQQEESLRKLKAAQQLNKIKFLPPIDNSRKSIDLSFNSPQKRIEKKGNRNNQINDENEEEEFNKEIKIESKKRNPNTGVVFKKLTTYCSLFIPEYDVLLVSASNKRISAWKYMSGEFKNANSIKEQPNIDKNYFSCSILVTVLPQYCMTW